MKKIILFVFSALLIMSIACRKDRKLFNNNNNYTPEPGLGTSTALPTGDTFIFPNGIVLTDSILVISGYYNCSSDTNRVIGLGSYVELLVPLRNTTTDTIYFTFPGGLICISDVIADQNGFLLQSYNVKVPPLTDWCFTLQLSCLNLSRHIPDDRTGYTRLLVTNSSKLNELVQIMNLKTILRYTNSNTYWYSSRLQDIIWTLCDDGTFSDEDRAYMNSIPNR